MECLEEGRQEQRRERDRRGGKTEAKMLKSSQKPDSLRLLPNRKLDTLVNCYGKQTDCCSQWEHTVNSEFLVILLVVGQLLPLAFCLQECTFHHLTKKGGNYLC